MNSSALFSMATFNHWWPIAFTPTRRRAPSLLIPPQLSKRFEKSTTRVRSRLSWKAESNAIVAIPSKVEESRDTADPYRREILRLRYAPLTITMLRQLFQQYFPA